MRPMLTTVQVTTIRALFERGASVQQISQELGYSLSTVSKYTYDLRRQRIRRRDVYTPRRQKGGTQ